MKLLNLVFILAVLSCLCSLGNAGVPTGEPSGQPTGQPTSQPSGAPTVRPTSFPTDAPNTPSGMPSGVPSSTPTCKPTMPTSLPTGQPSCVPSSFPSETPSQSPLVAPTSRPSKAPLGRPSCQPSGQPSGQPTGQPTGQPSSTPSQPSGQPTSRPTCPTSIPTGEPSGSPSGQPSSAPSNPTSHPSSIPTCPTGQPTGIPTCPTSAPTTTPSSAPSTYASFQISNSLQNATLKTSTSEIGIPLEMNISFRLIRDLLPEEIFIISLPRMTRSFTYSDRTKQIYGINANIENIIGITGRYQPGENASYGQVAISPSNDYIAKWVEGTYAYNSPYLDSELHIKEFHPARALQSGTLVEFTIHISNGIAAYCGSPSSEEYQDPNTLFYPIALITAQSAVPETDPTTAQVYKKTTPLIFQTFPAFYNTEQRRDVNFFTNASANTNTIFNTQSASLVTMKPGCSAFNDCSGHGACDHCYQKCHCVDGYGGPGDILTKGHNVDLTCSRRTCPAGRAITQLATSEHNAHSQLVECSNVGVCNRATGQCICSPPFTGAACDRMECPTNNPKLECSGHGVCLTMAELAFRVTADGPTVMPTFKAPSAAPTFAPTDSPVAAGDPTYQPTVHPTFSPSYTFQPTSGDPTPDVIIYGSSASYETGYTEYSRTYRHKEILGSTGVSQNTKNTWDAHVMRGCLCDSSWPVGLNREQRQLSEWFGPDCSLRHCPSGDNPNTSGRNSMNCNRISQTGRGETDGYGRFGNLCQVDCSDQGICDYTTGTCTCFKGYWGENCNTTIRGPTGARRVP